MVRTSSLVWLNNMALSGCTRLCPSIHLPTDVGWFLPLDFCDQHCCEHTCACIGLTACFQFSGVYTLEWNCWDTGNFFFFPEGESASRGGAVREGDRGSGAGLCADSREPDTGLELMNFEIMT